MEAENLLNELNLPEILKDRILCRAYRKTVADGCLSSVEQEKSCVLYLPTVVLRKRHNPAFSLACRLANHFRVPVVVVVTVLDDQHLSREPCAPVCMTARRLAFVLEALQSCTKEWEEHGAGVAIRLHGPGARIPHHLTLAHQAALAVVTDEPFVEPYRTYARKVAIACQTAKVPCFSVDGSTTVPPKALLQSQGATKEGDLCFRGVPSKAWMWEKKTEPQRKIHVYGALQERHLDAPPLQFRLPENFFRLNAIQTESDTKEGGNSRKDNKLSSLLNALPSKWRGHENIACPGLRPWSVADLAAIENIKEWVMTSWPGADTSVPPCVQTHGSMAAARRRWKNFLNHGLKNYAKQRNQIVLPHAVSRISCYLNLGILSIFDVLSDVWQAKISRSGYSAGCSKFLDEVVKWREIGYAHTFATPEYHRADVIPKWAQEYLYQQKQQQDKEQALSSSSNSNSGYTFEQLASSSTSDETWNAMQSYLVETGELHNNARMTWGKTMVHWQAKVALPEDLLWQVCSINDRFALDGLSPPSYAGLLWCFGWGDKPGSNKSITTKWAHRYRHGSGGFERAREALLRCESSVLAVNMTPAPLVGQQLDSTSFWTNASNSQKRKRPEDTNVATISVKSKKISSFFAPVRNGATDNDTSSLF